MSVSVAEVDIGKSDFPNVVVVKEMSVSDADGPGTGRGTVECDYLAYHYN